MLLEMRMLLQIKKEAEAGYSDVIVLHINHCMDNSFYFNEILKSIFSRVVFVASPYNNRRNETLAADDIYYTSENEDNIYKISRNNCETGITCRGFQEAIYGMIREAVLTDVLPCLKSGARLLIMEDGGYHYDVIRDIQREYPFILDHIVGDVEQTTSGTKRCMYDGKHYGFMYPCASVARSDIKMDLESIFIGRRVVEETAGFLYDADTFFEFCQVLVVGYGVVGRRVVQSLGSYQCNVKIYDTDEKICTTAGLEGYNVCKSIDRSLFGTDTVIIGCVGSTSFDWNYIKAFADADAENLYLASASSKNIEFIRLIEACRDEEEYMGLRIVQRSKERHFTHYEVVSAATMQGVGKKNIFLLAEGLPVNFYREDAISLTYRMIDLVFAEMLVLGMCLCDNKFEKKLMLLGHSEELKGCIDENELVKKWFEQNHLNGGSRVFLNPHPDKIYLRERFLNNE